MTDYFPKYYKKKQKRERLLGGITTALFSLIVVFVAVLLAIYTFRILKPGGPREGVKNLVEQGQKMNEQDQAKATALPATAAPKQPILKVSIDDELKFAQSLPQVNISIQGMYGGKEPPAATAPSANEQNGTGVSQPGSQPGGAQPSGDASAQPGGGSNQQAGASADDKKAEQTRKEKAKAAEEKRKAERAKEKAAEKKVSQPKPAPVSAGEPTYTYSVYAGQFKSRGEADTKRNEITQLGFSGAIVERMENEKPVYYLVVGDQYNDLQLALKLQERLKKAGFPGTVIHRRQKK